jgi:hypothetical protein
MEKCSYCVQRVNEARIEVKLKNMDSIPDGMFQSACQQACPTDAIVFGDISDTKTSYTDAGGATRTGSRVLNMRQSGRTYSLLGYLNTRPRTTYMLAIRNPNPELVSDAHKDWWKHPFDHAMAEPVRGQEAAGGHAALMFDSNKADQDAGYRLSLSVLGAHA